MEKDARRENKNFGLEEHPVPGGGGQKDAPSAAERMIDENQELKDLFQQLEFAKREWELVMDCVGDMVILADHEGRIMRMNRALKDFTGREYSEILGSKWPELLGENGFDSPTGFHKGAELCHRETARWFLLNTYPFGDVTGGEISGEVITIHESTELKKVTEELEKAYNELKATQAKILQQEKMASIGQLAAGIAHEINNPTGFIISNLGSLGKYMDRIVEFMNEQSKEIDSVGDPGVRERTSEARKRLKIDYIIEDIRDLIGESLDGADRVKKIVQDLKSFSRVDQAEYKHADINECMESTINIVWNELKYKATLHKEYGDVLQTKCYPQQLNQVFMNLLMNAVHAIDAKGDITIKTWNENGVNCISVSDTGCGIPEENLNRIFEPFFTTKEVGKGTGLGLSITYDIVRKHDGEITVESTVGAGTTFTVMIPVVEGG